MENYYPQNNKTDFKDVTLPVDQRVALLLREMTLEEKVGQLDDKSQTQPRAIAPHFSTT
jgi:hypothetical protein